MSDVQSLVRPEILAMRAYESARSLVSAQTPTTFLDANESPVPGVGPLALNRYPEPQPRALLQRFSELYAVPEKSIVIGRGSDEAIDLLVRAFCRAGRDSILICPPTYGVYEVSARIQGASVARAPLRLGDGRPELDEGAIRAAIRSEKSRVKLVFLCSPNNPTGTVFDADQLSRICEAGAGRAIVVVDEAYAEYSGGDGMKGRLPGHPNLVVLRTLSKAWAMAGVRCGVALASAELISVLHKVRAPYPLNMPTAAAVLEATGAEGRAALVRRVDAISRARDELAPRLRELPGVLEVFASNANFLLVRFKNPAEVMAATRAAGIVLRDRGGETGLLGCIRITIGSADENAALLSILRETLS